MRNKLKDFIDENIEDITCYYVSNKLSGGDETIYIYCYKGKIDFTVDKKMHPYTVAILKPITLEKLNRLMIEFPDSHCTEWELSNEIKTLILSSYDDLDKQRLSPVINLSNNKKVHDIEDIKKQITGMNRRLKRLNQEMNKSG